MSWKHESSATYGRSCIGSVHKRHWNHGSIPRKGIDSGALVQRRIVVWNLLCLLHLSVHHQRQAQFNGVRRTVWVFRLRRDEILRFVPCSSNHVVVQDGRWGNERRIPETYVLGIVFVIVAAASAVHRFRKLDCVLKWCYTCGASKEIGRAHV